MEEQPRELEKPSITKISTHNITMCRCGKVLWQCKCVGPKEVVIHQGPCSHKGLD